MSLLRDALMDAFDSDDFERLLSDHFNKRLADIAPPGAFSSVVFRVLQRSQAEGWTEKLIEAIQQARPDNPSIRNLASRLRLIDVQGVEHLVQHSLERTIKTKANVADFGIWMAKLERLRRMICRLEDNAGPRKALGTGFLVSHDLVLTNYHVVKPYIIGERGTAELMCRFDYFLDNSSENSGTLKRLASGPAWIVHYSKDSDVDPGD